MNRTERLENLSAAIDGELAEQDELTLKAWLDIHPEDLRDFEPVAAAVKMVRGIPQADPPTDLRSRILRAVAESSPVEVDRQTALEWLDAYFEDDLSLPQRQVVDHYLLVDADFAEKARLHAAMFSALSSVVDEEPPNNLSDRIRVAKDRGGESGAQRAARRPRLTSVGVRRIATTLLATAAVFALAFHWGRASRATAPLSAGTTTTNPSPVVTPPAPAANGLGQPMPGGQPLANSPVRPGQPVTGTAPDASRSANTTLRQPSAPVDAHRSTTPPPPRRNTTPRNTGSGTNVKDSGASLGAPASRVLGSSTATSPPPPRRTPVEPGNSGLAAGSGRASDSSVEGSGTGGVLGGAEKGGSRPDPLRQIEVPPF
ncbi:MAG: hypothetical protein HZB16_15875 [Armatimonadetes bacterium]|nr:hypothetical protein [Armatimonadota bacterium]